VRRLDAIPGLDLGLDQIDVRWAGEFVAQANEIGLA
jgi:hypothetical protein